MKHGFHRDPDVTPLLITGLVAFGVFFFAVAIWAELASKPMMMVVP